MDDNTIKWLFVVSTLIGFASAIVLSIDTVGLKLASRYIRKFRRTTNAAGAADPNMGVPVVVMSVTVVLSAIALWWALWVGPAAVWRSLTLKRALAVYFGLAVAAWVLSLVIMLVAELAIVGLRAIKWLHVRQYAGVIGFGLLAVSFALQIIASLADALKAPR